MIVLYFLIRIIEGLVLARVVVSWLPATHENRFVQLLFTITEPILDPVRRLLPTGRIGMDFSPIVVFLLLDLLKRAIFKQF